MGSGALLGTDFEGVLGTELPFFEGVLGDLRGTGEGAGSAF